MRLIHIFTVAMVLPLSVSGPGTASTVEEQNQRYHMGSNICSQVLDGKLSGFNATYYKGRISSGEIERASFCHCVGAEFTDDDDRFGLMKAEGDAAAKAMAAKITDALETCNSADGDLADTDEGGNPYDLDANLPDYEPANERLPIDESDRDMCNMAMTGSMLIPGFNEETIANRLKRTGQSTANLCACSARKMTAKSKQLKKEIEGASNPSVIYSSALGGAINSCLR